MADISPWYILICQINYFKQWIIESCLRSSTSQSCEGLRIHLKIYLFFITISSILIKFYSHQWNKISLFSATQIFNLVFFFLLIFKYHAMSDFDTNIKWSLKVITLKVKRLLEFLLLFSLFRKICLIAFMR